MLRLLVVGLFLSAAMVTMAQTGARVSGKSLPAGLLAA